ncbi:penicillin-binding transpeptidase domain-containing protein [Corynebacterium sphenisci]|uniref:penicillin-binding transpeptidase domain-containing protein n=1 Tax=Corynebacterium sphenisci TaxID=191493 RepID=UPI0026DEAFCA|nr:penicillin-binding transpeptidase domain-containing protein [Corynebacterium sphenisci]MDO5731021.1 penicillin-binding transpeptidase domain-containing protein [Corynebacterium sphenisci]
MNKAIRQAMIFSLVLVLLLLANLTWVQGFQRERYALNPLNSRQFLEEKSTPRGQITTGGEILASSEKGPDGFYRRSYGSLPEAYGPVVGYLSDVYGTAGVEQSRNAILNGTDPSLFTRRAIDAVTGREPAGASLALTLLPEAQQAAYRELSSRGYTGSVVALRPSTGEVLAMASTPSFDPNPIAANDEAAWAALNDDPDAPLLNHATQRPLPPGSTFKVLTTIAALESGRTPDTRVTGAPRVTLPNTETTLENYGGAACAGDGGEVDLRTAFAYSCNTAFAELAVDVGADPLRRVADRFRVGDTFADLGVAQQPSTIGEIPDDAALAQTAIGQRDVAMTPLNAAMIASAIANGGELMEPHLVKAVLGRNLAPLKETRPESLGEAVHPDTAAILTDLMRGAEAHAGGDANRIASKTGTAEHGEVRGQYAPHTWWIGFTLDSDVAIAVVVENGGDAGAAATGSSVAAPVGRAVIDAIERSGR